VIIFLFFEEWDWRRGRGRKRRVTVGHGSFIDGNNREMEMK